MPADPLTPEQIAGIRQAAAGHPRMFFAAADRERILARAADGLCRGMADRLRTKCEAYLDPHHPQHLKIDGYSSDALLARPGQYVLSRIMAELAFGGWLWDEPRYVAAARGIVLRRVREAFRTSPGHHRSHLAVGITGMPLALTADVLHPYLSRAEWAELVEHVRRYYIDFARDPDFERARLHMTGFNKTIAGMAAVGALALLVAEDLSDADLSFSVSEALRSSYGYAREGVDDDGGTFEGPGYGGGCLARVIKFGEALRRHGLPGLSRYEPLHRYGVWVSTLMVPKGGTLSLGDSFGHANIVPEMLLLAQWHDDPALRWAYLRGLGRADHRGGPYGDSFDLWISTLPQQLAWHDPSAPVCAPDALGRPPSCRTSGYEAVTLRADWSEDSVVAVITGCGRRALAPAHTGAEAAAIDLWAYGQELLADPGYGFATTDAHSSMQVVGREAGLTGGNARFGGRATRFAHGAFASLGGFDVSQMLDCKWAFRDVVLLRGRRPYLVVADDLNYRSDWAEYDWFWQADPSASLSVPSDGGPAWIRSGGAELSIHTFMPQADAYPKPYAAEWFAEDYQPGNWAGPRIPTLTRRRLRMRLGGYNGICLHVLAPGRAGDAAPAVTPLPCPVPGIAVRVELDGVVDTICFSPYNRFIQTGPCRANGRLAAVREESGAAAGWVLVNGYDLSWRGAALVAPQDRAGEWIGVAAPGAAMKKGTATR